MGKTFEDLEREVAGLRREIGKLGGNSSTANQEAVNALVDPYENDAHMRPEGTGMSKLSAELRQRQYSANLDRAIEFAAAHDSLPEFNLRGELARFGLTRQDEDTIVRRLKD